MLLQDSSHESVLKKEVLNIFMTSNIKTVFDGTLGLGGHAQAILEKFPQIEKYVGTDLDIQHLNFTKKRLKQWENKVFLRHDNFSSIKKIEQEIGFPRPLAVLLDLGICSNQVDDPEKGFSFMKDGPLNMSFDQKNSSSCYEIVNEQPEKALSFIFKTYGEEPSHHKIAKRIVEFRNQDPIKTTGELRSIIEKSVHPKVLKKTLMRVFQALRIATNNELDHLKKALKETMELLISGDRLGVMTFHSLEDRMVKQFFKKQTTPETEETVFSLHTEVKPPQARILTKKPIQPTEEEVSQNPRSRSVKFRIIEKI